VVTEHNFPVAPVTIVICVAVVGGVVGRVSRSCIAAKTMMMAAAVPAAVPVT